MEVREDGKVALHHVSVACRGDICFIGSKAQAAVEAMRCSKKTLTWSINNRIEEAIKNI